MIHMGMSQAHQKRGLGLMEEVLCWVSPRGDTCLDVPSPQAFGPALCARLLSALPSGQATGLPSSHPLFLHPPKEADQAVFRRGM